MNEPDPIVEEARQAGQAYIDSFGGDLTAALEDLRRRTEERRRAGWPVVSLPPRPITRPGKDGSKKVG